jgi:hypothetical protein
MLRLRHVAPFRYLISCTVAVYFWFSISSLILGYEVFGLYEVPGIGLGGENSESMVSIRSLLSSKVRNPHI